MKAITLFRNMKFSPALKVSLWLLLLAVFMVVDASAGAGSGLTKDTFFADNVQQGSTKISTGLNQLVQWVYWIFYLLGAVIMGMGAFKLKQGDVAGFGKNMAGGATLFFVPAAIKVFRSIGQTAWGN